MDRNQRQISCAQAGLEIERIANLYSRHYLRFRCNNTDGAILYNFITMDLPTTLLNKAHKFSIGAYTAHNALWLIPQLLQ